MGGNRTSVPRSAIAAKGVASAKVAERDAARNVLFIVLAETGRVALLDSSSSVSFVFLRTFVAHEAVDVDFMRRCKEDDELLLLRLIVLIVVVVEKDDVKEEEEANMVVLLCVSEKCLRVSSGALFNGRFRCLR
jgi:hypothetical protein